MARGITVKVAKDKVVTALKAKLESGAKATKTNEKLRKDNEKAIKEWGKKVADIAVKSIAKSEVSADKNWRDEVIVRFDFPAGTLTIPERPQIELEQELGRYEIQEIENAIRILEMSDEEFVSASTMKQIAQYL